MTFSLKDMVRGLFFNGSGSNGNHNVLAHEKEPEVLSRESYRSAKTILIVDDETSILSMRRLVFEALGYSVFTAASGEDALEVFAMYPVDAVVLDYLMPGMDGEQTARCMRKVRSDIPIILSSGCLAVPERVLKIVTAAVEKAAGPEALIEALAQQLALCSALSSPALVKTETQGWQALR
ncbi:MAG TPA: response regulator [Verrucomicrobiae bacterium]|nr:response regulator [Verrucomicrobiae bacterium]